MDSPDTSFLRTLCSLRWLATAGQAIAIVTAAFALGLAPYLMHSPLRLWGIPLFPLLGGAACLAGVILLALRLRR